MSSELNLNELVIALNRIIDDLNNRGITSILIQENGYLHINMDNMLDIYGQPVLSLGDYDEDIDIIRREPKEMKTVSYNYIQSLSSIIQYLGILSLRRP